MPGPTTGLGPIPPAGFESDQQASDYYEALRQYGVSQALQGAAFTPPQPQNWGPAASRISPLSIPLKMVEALMAKRAYGKYATSEARYYQGLMGQLGGEPQPPTMGAATGAAPAQASSLGPPAAGGPTQPAGPPGPAPVAQAPAPPPYLAADQQPPGQPPPGVMPPMPPHALQSYHPTALNPLGLNPSLASMILIRDPLKYAELQIGTPEWRNALAASGGDLERARSLLLAKAVKDGTIELRPGGEALVPGPQGMESFKNPNLPPGMSFLRGPTGEPIPYTLPGVLPYEQAREYATQLGKEQGSVQQVERGGRVVPQVGLGGIPGAPAGPPAVPGTPGAGAVPSYFPQQAPGAVPGTAGAPGAADRSWWPDMPQSRSTQFPAYGGLDPKQEMDLKLEREHSAKLNTQFGLEADTANQKLEYSGELLRALPHAYTGPQAAGYAQFWNTVAQVPWVNKFIPKGTLQNAAGTQQAIKNLVNQAIQGARALYGARMTQAEVMLQKNEANPSITQGILAIYALQRQEDAKSAYFIQRANDFTKYDAQNGNPMAFEQAYARKFPLATFARQYAERNAPVYQMPKEDMSPESIQLLQQHPEYRDAAIRRFGYLPPEFRQ